MNLQLPTLLTDFIGLSSFLYLGFCNEVNLQRFPIWSRKSSYHLHLNRQIRTKKYINKYAFRFYSLSINFRGLDVLKNIMKWRTLILNSEI